MNILLQDLGKDITNADIVDNILPDPSVDNTSLATIEAEKQNAILNKNEELVAKQFTTPTTGLDESILSGDNMFGNPSPPVGFVDENGVPTEQYQKLLDTDNDFAAQFGYAKKKDKGFWGSFPDSFRYNLIESKRQFGETLNSDYAKKQEFIQQYNRQWANADDDSVGSMVAYMLTNAAVSTAPSIAANAALLASGAGAPIVLTAGAAVVFAQLFGDNVKQIRQDTGFKLNAYEEFGWAFGITVMQAGIEIGFGPNRLISKNLASFSFAQRMIGGKVTRQELAGFGKMLLEGRLRVYRPLVSAIEEAGEEMAQRGVMEITMHTVADKPFSPSSVYFNDAMGGFVGGLGLGAFGSVLNFRSMAKEAIQNDVVRRLNAAVTEDTVSKIWGTPSTDPLTLKKIEESNKAWATFASTLPEKQRGGVEYMKTMAYNLSAETEGKLKPEDFIESMRYVSIDELSSDINLFTEDFDKMDAVKQMAHLNQKIPNIYKMVQQVSLIRANLAAKQTVERTRLDIQKQHGIISTGTVESSQQRNMLAGLIGKTAAEKLSKAVGTIRIGSESIRSYLEGIDPANKEAVESAKKTLKAMAATGLVKDIEYTDETGKTSKFDARLNADLTITISKSENRVKIEKAEKAKQVEEATAQANAKPRTDTQLLASDLEVEGARIDLEQKHVVQASRIIENIDSFFSRVEEPAVDTRSIAEIDAEERALADIGSQEGFGSQTEGSPQVMAKKSGVKTKTPLVVPETGTMTEEERAQSVKDFAAKNALAEWQKAQTEGNEQMAEAEKMATQGTQVYNPNSPESLSLLADIVMRPSVQNPQGLARNEAEQTVAKMSKSLRTRLLYAMDVGTKIAEEKIPTRADIGDTEGQTPMMEGNMGVLSEANKEEQRSKKNPPTGFYFPQERLALFYKDSDAVTVVHEWIHHIRTNGLIQGEYAEVLNRAFKKVDGTFDDEAMVDQFMAYIRDGSMAPNAPPELKSSFIALQKICKEAAIGADTLNPELAGIFGKMTEVVDKDTLEKVYGEHLRDTFTPDYFANGFEPSINDNGSEKIPMAEDRSKTKDSSKADSYFNQKELDLQREVSSRSKSRSRLIYMTPQEFLSIAEDIGKPDEQKLAKVRESAEAGQKWNDIPFVTFTHDGKGTARVSDHEGRHRAMYLIEKGITEMPVVLTSENSQEGDSIRWGEQSDPESNDRISQTWPTTLYKQGSNDTSIPFPVPDLRSTQSPLAEDRNPKGKYENGGKSTDRLFSILEDAGITPRYKIESSTIGNGKTSDTLYVYWQRFNDPNKQVGVQFYRTRLPEETEVPFEPTELGSLKPSYKMNARWDNVTHNSMVNAVREYVKEAKSFTEQPLSEDRPARKVNAIVDSVANKYGKDSLAGGNCGMFALALHDKLKSIGVDSTIEFVFSNKDGGYKSLQDISAGEVDVYHVAVNVEGILYDGTGETSRQALFDIAKDQYGDTSPAHVENVSIDGKDGRWIKSIIDNDTNWTIDRATFLQQMMLRDKTKDILAEDRPTRKVRQAVEQMDRGKIIRELHQIFGEHEKVTDYVGDEHLNVDDETLRNALRNARRGRVHLDDEWAKDKSDGRFTTLNDFRANDPITYFDQQMLAQADYVTEKHAQEYAKNAPTRSRILSNVGQDAARLTASIDNGARIGGVPIDETGPIGWGKRVLNRFKMGGQATIGWSGPLRSMLLLLDNNDIRAVERPDSATAMIGGKLLHVNNKFATLITKYANAYMDKIRKDEFIRESEKMYKLPDGGPLMSLNEMIKLYALAQMKRVTPEMIDNDDAFIAAHAYVLSNTATSSGVETLNQVYDFMQANPEIKAKVEAEIMFTQQQNSELFPLAATVYKNLTGRELPMQTKGIYTSMVRADNGSMSAMDIGSVLQDIEQSGERIGGYMNALREFKHRRGGEGSPLSVNFRGDHIRHMENLANYATKAEAVAETLELINNARVRDSIKQKLGSDTKTMATINDLIRAEMKPNGNISSQVMLGDTVLAKIRERAFGTYMPYNFTSYLSQVTAVFPAFAEVASRFGYNKTGKALVMFTSEFAKSMKLLKVLTNGGDIKKALAENDTVKLMERLAPHILLRTSSPDQLDYKRSRGHGVSQSLSQTKGMNKYAEIGMLFIEVGDWQTVIPAWRVAFELKKQEMMENGTDEDIRSIEDVAAAVASDVVGASNNASIPLQKSKFQRSPEAYKTLIPFSGQTFVMFNNLINSFAMPVANAMAQNKQAGVMAQVKGVAKTINDNKMIFRGMVGWVLPAIALGMLARRGPQKDKEEVFTDLITYLLMSVPLVGGLIIANMVIGGSKGGYKGSPEFYKKLVGDSVKGMSRLAKGDTGVDNWQALAKTLSLATGTPQFLQRAAFSILENSKDLPDAQSFKNIEKAFLNLTPPKQ